MAVYVLDSSAVIRYVDDEAGASRVEEILSVCVAGNDEICISAVQWGEIAGNLRKRFGAMEETRIMSSVLPSEVVIVAATGDRATRAADLRVDRNIAYADAFALELAMDSANHVLVTADYGFKSVADLVQIEFLPAK
ncbi:MAG TPA: PIN domain-containing protein [Terracidiphilus sp.]|nr:PIN domain-containing protein [Terracidiphilus sp.]